MPSGSGQDQAFISRYGGAEVATLKYVGNGQWQAGTPWVAFEEEKEENVQGSNNGQPAMTGMSPSGVY